MMMMIRKLAIKIGLKSLLYQQDFKRNKGCYKNKVITKKVWDEVINALSTLILVHTIN